MHVLKVSKMDATAARVILAPKYLDNHLLAMACNRGGERIRMNKVVENNKSIFSGVCRQPPEEP